MRSRYRSSGGERVASSEILRRSAAGLRRRRGMRRRGDDGASLAATIGRRCATSCRCGSSPTSRPLPNLPATLRPMLPRPHRRAVRLGRSPLRAVVGRTAGARVRRAGRGRRQRRRPDRRRRRAGRRPRAARAGRAGGPARRPVGGPRRRARRRRRRRPGRRRRARARGSRGEPRPAGRLLAFDLLHLDGRSLLSAPLHRRRELLRRVLRPGRRGRGRARDRRRGPGAPRGGRGPGDRRRHGPPADEPRTCPGVTSRGCGGSSRSALAAGAAMRPARRRWRVAETPPTAAAPVVALIRRLPLLFDE